MKLLNKIAIVTGAASGFGEAIAHRFVENGARVAIADLNADKAAAVARALGEDKAIAVRTDVSSRPDIERLIAEVTGRFGTPDIIVNNAGFTHKNRPLLEVDEATFDRVFSVNVKSIYHMVHAAVPAMRDNGGGVILNVGSVAGIRPRPGLTWYNGSKGAANMLSKSLAVELAPWNIRVNAICPVMGVTGMLEDFMGMPDTPENRAKFLSSIPLGRLCEADDVAQAALYLAAADFITGVELPVDGGRTV
ncbi:short-chain dehydrogenase/reductase SDR [Methylorubrum populi BJ001]|jgi:3-oxoacyl-[acyl-carrier protein] reductase|uniref:Short-chain dehydrogenase/reductase SDR n=2 Tax=Methylorubrum TaxID=2282523 RepID=B1ZCR1_METPB|nr:MULTISPECIES: SDR family oxidoreductase [Methylorubrum]ACB79423.1 short-chain dehydrogenase/reductase SDR [Methylorubrum populi BJ001]MBA8913867.1 3-oxoacyl-[acyl-carrier protein] reductase [Methylorubrum thiocyanatum]OAH37118.1 3-ketoacyl-ACP reductase [Methylorubrum populi]PZP69579.1 MAG: SDR family NAD(P)-dependent oxidoreductase [Methylorubrum populi]GJE82598.1 4-formylbenzenesulfonate dehydrogenase TsaC1/TsaC2 [Methylorubrum thiocyanatum]